MIDKGLIERLSQYTPVQNDSFFYSKVDDTEMIGRFYDGKVKWRHFFNGTEWLTLFQQGNEVKNSSAKLNGREIYYFKSDTPPEYSSIAQAEETIIKRKRDAKKDKERQRVIDLFKDLPSFNDEQVFFMQEKVLPYYVFFNKKDDYAHCTACHSTYSPKMFAKTRQNLETYCPKCGAKVHLKGTGVTTNISDSGTAIFIQNMGDKVCMRYASVYKSYRESFTEPEFRYKENVREVFDGKSAVFYEFYFDEWKKCNVATQSSYYHHQGDAILHTTIYSVNACFNPHFESELIGTPYEHCCLDYFYKYIDPVYKDKNSWHFNSPWKYRWWLKEYTESHRYEYLYKVGFKDIAYQYWFELTSSIQIRFNPEAKKLHEMLRITKSQYKELLKIGNPSPFILACMQNNMNYSIEEYKILEKYLARNGEISRYSDLFKFSVHKFDKYFSSKCVKGSSVREYFDYLDTANKLHWDLHNDFIAFPKHLSQAHRNANAEFNLQQNKEKRAKAVKDGKAYAKRVKDLIKQYAFEFNGLQIVVPKNCGQILDEGVILRHCVGTYVDRVRKCETLILFIRKINDVNTPFYTMEVKNGKVTQCYGYRDCRRTEEVGAFVNKFSEAKHLIVA